jgi:hypothetical protein
MAAKGKARVARDASNFTEKLSQSISSLTLFNPTITLKVVTGSVADPCLPEPCLSKAWYSGQPVSVSALPVCRSQRLEAALFHDLG